MGLFNTGILIAVGYYLWQNVTQITLNFADFHYPRVFISLLFPVFFYFNAAIIFYLLNKVFHLPFGLPQSFQIYFGSFLAAYIPGRAFVLIKRHLMSRNNSVPFVSMLMVYFTEAVVMVLGAVIFAGLVILFSGRVLSQTYFVMTVVIFICLAICIHPALLNSAYRFYQKWRGVQNIQKFAMSYQSLWKIILAYVINWGIYSLGIMWMLSAIYNVSQVTLIYLAGIYILAGVLGMLAVILPMGLGVREGVVIIGFSPIIGAPQAAFCAILMRIWSTVSEILCFIVYKLLEKGISLLREE
jgi:glycosyltransferase 2 family protein